MPEKIVQLNEEVIKGQLKELVRGSVEETLNELLEAEAEKLTQAARYERNEQRQGYRSGHYSRSLTTTSGEVTLKVPKLKGISFETAIIERYRRRESSVEEALIEMYLAGISVRRVEDITEALWGSKVSPSTISELNKKAYVHIEEWRNRPLQGGRYPYVYVDGIYLRRNWGGEFENVAILVAIAVNEDGYREVLGAAEGMKEDKASWVSFFQWLRGRGLDGVKLVVGDKCLGMLEAVGEVFPEAKYQRCTVHFYRNVFSVTPRSKVKLVSKMLKAIHAQESKKAAREKAKTVVEELRSMKLKEAAKKVEDGIEETLTYCDFPSEHWTRIRTNNVIERLNREIRRRTRVVGSFPDGSSALMLVCARLRHVAGTQWGNKKYMNMKHLEVALEDASIASPSFNSFSSISTQFSAGAEAAEPPNLRISASGNTQYELTQGINSPWARRFTLDPMGQLPSTRQRALPLAPNKGLRPLYSCPKKLTASKFVSQLLRFFRMLYKSLLKKEKPMLKPLSKSKFVHRLILLTIRCYSIVTSFWKAQKTLQ